MRGEGSGNHDEQEPPRRSSDRASGFVALLRVVRGLPERLKRPESLIMLMAMLASLGAHMPPYVGLGALAEYFEKLEREKPKHDEPVEVSFELAEPTKPEEPKLEEPKPEPPKPEQAKLEPKKPEEEAKKKAEPEKPKPEEPKVAVSELQLPEPPKPEERKQSVTQKSEDPNVQPPPDAKFLAEENSVVDEETVAKVTSETRDDPNPTESAPNTGDEQERFGEDAKQDQRGAERGSDEENPPKVASLDKPKPQPSLPPPPEPTQTPQPSRPSIKPTQPAPAPAQQPQIIHDPLGSFVLAPQRPTAPGREGQAARPGVAGTQPNIKVSWRAFEDTFGAEQLAQDRMPREAKRRGAGREKKWAEFRAAIENYVQGVKPGNQTKLNAAADPFAAYLAAFHRNLHMEFAHEFLGSLPALGDLGDMDLVTKVEIVVNPDGTLDRVGIVKSSGNLMYDFGAFNAVQRGAPYPPAPEKIRSSDGRVYMRWALHRNESQCGTWNAEPYILKDPPRSPNDPKPDNVSPFRNSGEKGEHGRAPEPEPVKAPAALPPGETLGEEEHAKYASKA